MKKNFVNTTTPIMKRCYSTAAATIASEVLIHQRQRVTILELNRPKQLNALNLNMVQLMQPVYLSSQSSTPSSLYILKSSNAQQKAFCAGGDIKDIYYTKNSEFFNQEYTLDETIGTLQVPHISILDGITMGGGVGISVHGSTRVATEFTTFAMPETQIGFFCDVGGGYFLPRLENNWGMWLALTGSRLKGEQVAATGIATHFVSRDKLPELEQFLISEAHRLTRDNINQVIDSAFKQDRQSWQQSLHDVETVSQVFGKPSVKQIIQELEKISSSNVFAQKTLEQLNKMSPTSLRVVHRQVTLGKHLNLSQVMEMERGIANRMLQQHDFFEGVRSLLVDKDNKYEWQPSKLQDVKRSDIDEYFTRVPVDIVKRVIPDGEEF
jgi:3-hydroxyisobutyryl-CoA hydrolase